MSQRDLSVNVTIKGDASGLNAALSAGQSQAAALKQSVQSIASAMPQRIAGPQITAPQVAAPARPAAAPSFAPTRPPTPVGITPGPSAAIPASTATFAVRPAAAPSPSTPGAQTAFAPARPPSPAPQQASPTELAELDKRYGPGMAQQLLQAGTVRSASQPQQQPQPVPAVAGPPRTPAPIGATTATNPVVPAANPIVAAIQASGQRREGEAASRLGYISSQPGREQAARQAALDADVRIAEGRQQAERLATPLAQRQQRQEFSVQAQASLARGQARLAYERGPVGSTLGQRERELAGELTTEGMRGQLGYVKSLPGRAQSQQQLALAGQLAVEQQRQGLEFSQSEQGRELNRQRQAQADQQRLEESRQRFAYGQLPEARQRQIAQAVVHGDIGLQEGQGRLAYEESVPGRRQAQERQVLGGRQLLEQQTQTLAFQRSAPGRAQAQEQQTLAGLSRLVELGQRFDFQRSAPGREQAQQVYGLQGQQAIEQERQRQAFQSSAVGQRIGYDQAQLAALGRQADAEQRLAFLRSGPGSAATIQAIQAEQALARQQEYLAKSARQGRASAALDAAHDRLQPLFSAASRGAAVTGGIIGAGVAATPVLAEQMGNSFRFLAGEIGISTIPAMTQLSGVAQNLARDFRRMNERSGGWLGTGLVGTALTLGGIGLAGQGLRLASGAMQGLSWGARMLGFASDVGATAVGQGVANAAGRAVGRAEARAAGMTAGEFATGVVGVGGGGLLATPAATVAAPLLVGTWLAGAAWNAPEAWRESGRLAEQDPRRDTSWRVMETISRSANWGGTGGSWNPMNVAGLWNNFIGTRLGMQPLSSTANPWGAPTNPRLMTNPQGQLTDSVESLYDRALTQITNMTPDEADQEGRAYRELIQAIKDNTAAIEFYGTRGSGLIRPPEAE